MARSYRFFCTKPWAAWRIFSRSICTLRWLSRRTPGGRGRRTRRVPAHTRVTAPSTLSAFRHCTTAKENLVVRGSEREPNFEGTSLEGHGGGPGEPFSTPPHISPPAAWALPPPRGHSGTPAPV